MKVYAVEYLEVYDYYACQQSHTEHIYANRNDAEWKAAELNAPILTKRNEERERSNKRLDEHNANRAQRGEPPLMQQKYSVSFTFDSFADRWIVTEYELQ